MEKYIGGRQSIPPPEMKTNFIMYVKCFGLKWLCFMNAIQFLIFLPAIDNYAFAGNIYIKL